MHSWTSTRFVVLLAVVVMVGAACGNGEAETTTTAAPTTEAPQDTAETPDTTAADESTPDTTADETASLSYDLVIGDLVSLTGAENVFGPSFQAAAELAKGEIEAAVEEAGLDISISLEHADDETTPQGAVAAARRLVASGADCIAGPLTSGATLAVGEAVTAPEGIPNIAVAATSIAITDMEDDGMVFRLLPSDELQGPALASVIAEDFGGAEDVTLSLAARNDAFGEGFITNFQAAWESIGGSTTGDPVLYDPEAASADSEAQAIVAGEPDAFVVIDFPASYARMGAALLRTGEFDGSMLYVAGGQPATIPEDVPFDSMNNARGTRPGVPEDSEALEAFFDLYDSTPDNPPIETFAQNNFDATMLCFLASVAAGSDDSRAIAEALPDVSAPPGTEYTWLELGDAVSALAAGEDIDYQGVSGAIDFDDNGDPASGIYDIYEYQEGEQTKVGQIDTATLGN